MRRIESLVVPLIIICFISFACAIVLYFVGMEYPTVGCLTGDCLFPNSTPLWVVALGFAILSVLCILGTFGAWGIAIWSYKKH